MPPKNVWCSFPDKKERKLDYQRVVNHLEEGRKIAEAFSIGQRKATWKVKPEMENVPIGFTMMSDLHFGSILIDYPVLNQHLKDIEHTPNMYLGTNGDHVDFFNADKHPTGMYENPISPQMQARTIMGRFKQLDDKGKVAVLSQGNHDNFGKQGGQDFYDSFMSDFKCPIFTTGGVLTIEFESGVSYTIVINHTFWGRSKINITNPAKRMIEYETGGTADVGWVGHTHQSSFEYYDKGSKSFLAVVSGTYKATDPWASSIGLGSHPGDPGITLLLWPNKFHMECCKNYFAAKQIVTALGEAEKKKK